VGYQCLNCKKKKKYSVRDFVTIVFTLVRQWRLDHEAGVEYCSFGIQTEIWSMRKSATAASYCLLGLSSEVKVGVTRKTQVPTRWIDQGAIEAVSIVEVPNRI
jgi:hypothetical protein